MTEVARLRFKSLSKPKESGKLLLHDDGTIQVQPSEALRDEMARLEEVALRRAHVFGTRLGVCLLIAGSLSVGLGWLVGRIFGKMGYTLSAARSVSEVSLTRDEGGGVHLTLHGANRLQKVQMNWNGDEILRDEADQFVAKFNEMRQSPE